LQLTVRGADSDAIHFHGKKKKLLWKSMATNILQNVFCVQQKKETHTGLKQRKSEYMKTSGELTL